MLAIRLSQFAALPLMFPDGCVMNSMHQLSPDAVARSRQAAVVVYGIQVEGNWEYPQFTVQLAEYSVKDQAGTGNCFTFNRAEATVPAATRSVRYFAFKVPAGHYTYGPFNAAPLVGETLAFSAVEGRLSYIGNFVYTSAKQVELRRNIESFQSALPAAFAGTSNKFVLAEAVSVQPPRMFLCTP
jgi:hypothetical protein